MNTRQVHLLGNRAALLLPGLFAVVVWEAISRTLPHGAFLFGSPTAVIAAALHDFRTADLFRDIGLTAAETFVGLVLGCAVGTIAGLALCLSRALGRVCEPYIVVMSAVPMVAMAPFVIQVLGTGFVAKAALAGFSALLVSLSLAYQGALTAQKEWIELAQSLSASQLTVIRKIRFPNALTFVLAGARMNVGFALIGAFVGEFISSDAGLGRYILRYGGIYDMPRVFLGVALLAMVGLTFSYAISLVGRRWAPQNVNQFAIKEFT